MLKLLLGIPIENYLSLLDSLESLIDDGLFESSINQSESVANNIDVKLAENNVVSESYLTLKI
mgnify:CR=1 FL=1